MGSAVIVGVEESGEGLAALLMLLFLSNRVLVGEPCLVSGGELMVVVEASFEL